MHKGLDVSSNNHPNGALIDWAKVAAFYKGITDQPFVIIKVSQGADYVNPYWQADRAAAHAAGFTVGLYHYAEPSKPSPTGRRGADEARFFEQAIGKGGGIQDGEFLALDLEYGANPNETDLKPNADLKDYTLDFLATIESALGIKPFLYSGHFYLEPHNCEGHAELGAYPLWLASYQEELPPTPAGWNQVAIWQHDCHGSIPGIVGDVDLDWCYVDLTPYTWHYTPDPFHGQVVDTIAPDTGINEAAIDASYPLIIIGKIRQHLNELINAAPQDEQNAIGMIRADLDQLQRVMGMGGH